VGKKIKEASNLVVGTPTYWGNMSGPLKILFDRNVPVFEYIDPRKGFPKPRQKGKKAVIVTVSSSPWPYNLLRYQSRGAIRAVATVLRSGGYRLIGIMNLANTRKRSLPPERMLRRARKIGRRL
jgi:multimeric flavodoxin WrbA